MGYPLFASKQTFARIVFLPQGERLETKRALRMLNFLLKTRHEKKIIMPCSRAWATVRKARTLTTASASGCRAYIKLQ